MSDTSAESQAQRLESAYEQLAKLLQQPNVAQRLRNPASEDEWSAMQILGHTLEIIPYWLNHCRTIIASTGAPPHFGRALDAPERLEGIERGASGDPDEIMRQIKDEVQVATKAIRGMSETERNKKGIHSRRGEMNVTDVIEVFIVAHAEEHLAQVREALRV